MAAAYTTALQLHVRMTAGLRGRLQAKSRKAVQQDTFVGMKAGILAAQVYKRGAPPGGGGEVHVRVPVARSLPPVSLLEEGDPSPESSALLGA